VSTLEPSQYAASAGGETTIRRGETAIVGALTLLGLALRLRLVGNSLFGDELSTYSIVHGHGVATILRTLNGHSVDLTPPLYFLLTWLTTRAGSSPETFRLVACAAGTATIPLTYLLGRRTVGRLPALIGTVLVALSPFLIFYSTEARAYALVMCLVLASSLALLEALASNRLRWWLGYAVFECAAVYSHYTAIFALGAQLLWALFTHRPRRRPLLVANLAAAIGFAPWLPALIKNARSFGTKVFEIVDPFGWHAVGHDMSLWAVGHPYLRLSSEPGTLAVALIVSGVLGGLAGSFLAWRQGSRQGSETIAAGPALVMLLAVASPLGLGLYSALGTSAWDARNLISSWPGFALTLGFILASPRRSARVLTIGLALLGFGIGAVKLLACANQRPDYAAAAGFVLSQGARHDPVAVIQAPTPGPYAAVDAAFAFAGDSGRPLLRIGSPSLTAVLRAPPYALLAATPTTTLVAQTLRATGDAKLFVIAPGHAPVSTLLGTGSVNPAAVLGPVFGAGTTGALFGTVFAPLSSYLRAISSQFEPVRTFRLPGFLALSVYVFKRR
jgi:hypothetical protein